MAYIGEYSKIFLLNFLKTKWYKRSHQKIDILGVGFAEQWVVDIKELAKKIPSHYFDTNQTNFIDVLTDVINIVVLEELLHSLGVFYHADFGFILNFFFRLIKTKKELDEFKKSQIYKYISFCSSLNTLVFCRGNKWPQKIVEEVNNLRNILKNSPKLEKKRLKKILIEFLKYHKV